MCRHCMLSCFRRRLTASKQYEGTGWVVALRLQLCLQAAEPKAYACSRKGVTLLPAL